MEGMNRPVVNANVGVTNMIEDADIKGIMLETFDTINQVLSEHSGPFGKFAVITDPMNPMAEPIFTKDGINIVRKMEFISPMQEFVKRAVAYIGERIEAAAGDGTTSSMIIATTVLKEVIKDFAEYGICVSYQQLSEQYNRFVTKVEEDYSRAVLSVDNLIKVNSLDAAAQKKLIWQVAYAQAYTSSHGDDMLSKAVADMFTTIPQSTWNYVNFERERFETTERIKVNFDDNDFTSECVIFNNVMLNTDMGLKYVAKDVDLVIANTDLAQDNMILFQPVLNHISDAIKEDKPLVIFTSSMIDMHTRSFLDETLRLHPGNKVAIFTYHPESDCQVTDLTILQLLARINPALPEDKITLVPGVDIEYSNHVIKINKLYENPDDSIEHPYQNDKTFPIYKEVINHMLVLIEKTRKEKVTMENERAIMNFQRIYNRLVLTKRVNICIGGSAHDNAAAKDVVMDSITATRCTLMKGFVHAGNRTLYSILENYDVTDNRIDSIFCSAFHTAIQKAVASTLKFTQSTPVTEQQIVDYLDAASYDVITGKKYTSNEFSDYLFSNEIVVGPIQPIIIQPSTIDINILKRFGEVALKFIQTARIIAPGSVYLTAASKKELTMN